MTGRELREIRLLRVEGDPRVAGRLREHLDVVDARRFELMRFVEGKSWETIARRLHYERTAPGKVVRRWFARRG